MPSATRSVLAITSLAILTAMALTAYSWRPLDGIPGATLAMVLPNDTFCAPGYTENGFQATTVGMTRTQVYNLLGKPLGATKCDNGETVECWTCRHQATNYHRRELIFRDDEVVEKIAEFDRN